MPLCLFVKVESIGPLYFSITSKNPLCSCLFLNQNEKKAFRNLHLKKPPKSLSSQKSNLTLRERHHFGAVHSPGVKILPQDMWNCGLSSEAGV